MADLPEADFDARLETIALALERRAGNKVYKRAWLIAAAIIRGHKISRGYQPGDVVNVTGHNLVATRTARTR